MRPRVIVFEVNTCKLTEAAAMARLFERVGYQLQGGWQGYELLGQNDHARNESVWNVVLELLST